MLTVVAGCVFMCVMSWVSDYPEPPQALMLQWVMDFAFSKPTHHLTTPHLLKMVGWIQPRHSLSQEEVNWMPHALNKHNTGKRGSAQDLPEAVKSKS